MSNSDFQVLPFRVLLLVTQEWYQLRCIFDEIDHPNIVKLFFGKFKNDPTKTVFSIFQSIYVEQSQMMKFYDPPVLKILPIREIKSVEFNYVYYSYVSNRFLNEAKKLVSLERCMVHEDMNSIIPSVINLRKFIFAVHEMDDNIIGNVTKLKKLNYWGYKLIDERTVVNSMTKRDLEMSSLKKLFINSVLPKSFTFSKAPNLQLLHVWYASITSAQFLYLSNHPSLREVMLDRCRIGNRAINLFQSRSIRRVCMNWCNLTVSEDTIKDFEIDGTKSQLEAVEFGLVKEYDEDFWVQFLSISSLRKMFLSNTDLGDSFLQNLITRKEDVKWEKDFYLQLSTTVEVTKGMETMFRKEFPHVELKIFRKYK